MLSFFGKPPDVRVPWDRGATNIVDRVLRRRILLTPSPKHRAVDVSFLRKGKEQLSQGRGGEGLPPSTAP